jgi:hypothetical protein
MNAQVLTDVATMRVADDKGLLAMDESNGTCNKRFATVGILQTEEAPARISRIDCNHACQRRAKCRPMGRRDFRPCATVWAVASEARPDVAP